MTAQADVTRNPHLFIGKSIKMRELLRARYRPDLFPIQSRGVNTLCVTSEKNHPSPGEQNLNDGLNHPQRDDDDRGVGVADDGVEADPEDRFANADTAGGEDHEVGDRIGQCRDDDERGPRARADVSDGNREINQRRCPSKSTAQIRQAREENNTTALELCSVQIA